MVGETGATRQRKADERRKEEDREGKGGRRG